MTEPNDTTSTRPISVAELLAKNGSIGAPSPGGRRRRRRGNADAVTVAELTGEIPIVNYHTDEHQAIDVEPEPEPEAREAEPEAPEVEPEQPAAEAEPEESQESAPDEQKTPDEQQTPDEAAAADYEAHVERRDADFEPLAFDPRAHRTHHGLRRSAAPHAGGAEEMSPDPLVDDEDVADAADAALDAGPEAVPASDDTAAFPSYLSRVPGPEDIDLDGADAATTVSSTAVLTEEPGEDVADAQLRTGSPVLHGLWIVAQSIFAVVFGAGLFVAFDQLWKWNNIVALVLSVLVILGLVVGVRVVRRTEDIASTLIAVAVGALVTLGPLALLQST